MTTPITKEQLQRIIESADEILSALAGTNDDVNPDNSTKMCGLWDDLNDRHAPPEVVRELACIALAAMDAEPVAWIVHTRTGDQLTTNGGYVANAEGILGLHSTPLYTAPPAPVVAPTVVPDGLRLALSNAGIAAPESDEMLAATCDKHIQALVTWVKERKSFTPAPVVPDEKPMPNPMSMFLVDAVAEFSEVKGWNACRAAMLQSFGNSEQLEPVSNRDELPATQQPQNSQQNIPENIPATRFQQVADLYGITSPTGSETTFTFDAFEASNFAKGGWSVQEYVELERYQQAVTGNSPVIPDCWCRTCRPVTIADMRFVVCPDCGNKRCPKANDHRNDCTGSNEPGQEGSAYPAAPQQEGK